MESSADWGLLSLIPLAVTLLLAFLTRSAVIAMLTGTFVGTLMLGGVPGASLNQLFQASLGKEDFIWIVLIVVLLTQNIVQTIVSKHKFTMDVTVQV